MAPRLKKASLKVTAFKSTDFPESNPGEIAFAGRSNVGKSSLLNRIMGTKKLVKVSSRPGFTQSINFYSIIIGADQGDFKFFFVDLPGYGYAKAPRSVVRRWERLVGSYFSSNRLIKAVVTIFDVRRDPDVLDLELLSFLRFHGLNAIPVLNKCDKLGGGALYKRTQSIKEQLGRLGVEPGAIADVFSVSARTGRHVELLRSLLLSTLMD